VPPYPTKCTSELTPIEPVAPRTYIED